MKRIIRCDDFDPRLDLIKLKEIHQLWLDAKVPMTIAVNNASGHRFGFDQAVLDYINKETPAESWDIQLHSFNHERMWALTYPECMMNLYSNLHITKEQFPRSNPTIYYPPWNEESETMAGVCKELGITMKESHMTLRELLWNGREDRDLFFYHWWDVDDRKILPEAIKKLVLLNSQ